MFETESSKNFSSAALWSNLLAGLPGASLAILNADQTPQWLLDAGWQQWLETLFPNHVRAGFGPHHAEFWAWVWALHAAMRPAPFVAIWPRGGAKSSSAELACVAVAARRVRRYGLYISETQELADKHVMSIGALLESDAIARYYPSLGERDVSKYGASKGWRRNRLRTASGFTIDSVGLDTATRGIKVEDARPDFMIVDDVDSVSDTPQATTKKITTLTQSILPAGSIDLAVLAVQNLITQDSIFSRLAGRSRHEADFLADRIVSGPFPAILDLVTERQNGRSVIVSGTPLWQGQDLNACQDAIDTYGERAFRRESQQQVDLDTGSKFRREWFPIVDEAPVNARRVRYWDLAATEAKPGTDPDWTAGALVAEKDGQYWICDIAHFRGTPQINEQRVRQTADLDGLPVDVYMEQEPGSGGVNTIDHYARTVLKGRSFHGDRVTGSKELRANPVSSAAEAGNVFLVRGLWNAEFLDEAVAFPGGAHDDMVDAVSGAVQAIATGPQLPFGWLRSDPAFRERTLGPTDMTDEERIARRRAQQGTL